MAYGTTKIKLRPIKLAFLVDPTDRNAVLEAIEINTFLWGGMFNPIIPTFERKSKVWQDRALGNLNSKKILAGYLDAYDPDYVVPLGTCQSRTFDVGNRQLISSSEILAGVEQDGTPRYGIGLFEILRYFIDKELKFHRREPLDIYLPNFARSYRLFMASIFGALPQNIDKILRDNFEEILEPERFSCSISNYSELLTPDKIFLRRITSLYLNPIYLRGWRPRPCIFYLDATKTLDIIDYWNLRAGGWNIIPMAKQASESDSAKRLAFDFIEQNYVRNRFNPEIYDNTILLKSSFTSEKDLEYFAESLKIPPHDKHSEPKYLFQDWYPRIWDKWARDKDGVECCELEARTTQYDLSNYEGRISFKTLDPKFITRFGGHGGPRFANEIDLRVYGSKEFLAEVIPEGDKNLVRAIGSIGPREWRFSKRGMVYLSRYSNWSVPLSIPKGEDVFLEWLRAKQWTVEVSGAGHIAKQMAKHLGGTWGISTLANEGIIKLLEKMGEGKSIDHDAFWAKISKIAGQEQFIKDPDRILRRLVEVQMFRLGVKVQCPICRQRSWYSIKEADYELQCLKCLERFPIPSHSPNEIRWSYRAFGPFSLPKQAYGIYSVLLTLRFFSQLLDGPTTPIMSFVAKKNGRKIEADLGIFFQWPKFGYSKTELTFAECKTYNNFDKKDTDRMAFLAEKFPGAVLAFATLKKSLTEKEKRLLGPVVNRGRRYWKAERPFNPVLILTGTELFSDLGLPHCWEDAGGVYRDFAKNFRTGRDLLQLCDATQQIYLDMKPWHQWLEEDWEKRRKKRRLLSKRKLTRAS